MCNLVHEMHETATNNTDGQAAAVEDVDGHTQSAARIDTGDTTNYEKNHHSTST